MQYFDDDTALARLLPGRWTLKATNDPLWLTGEGRDPLLEYELLREQPLTLRTRVTYVDAEGKPKTITGTDQWNGQGFTRKKGGVAGLFLRGRWEVAGARQGLAVLRFHASPGTTGGVDVVVTEGTDASELRSVVASDPASFGLALEEFAALTWLEHTPPVA